MALCELLPARASPTHFSAIYFKYKSVSHQCNHQHRGIQEPVFSYWSCQGKKPSYGEGNLVTPGFSYAPLTLTVSFRTYCSTKIAACAIWPRPVLQAIFFHSFTPEQLPLFISVSKISHAKSEHDVLAMNYTKFHGIPTRLEHLNIVYVRASVKNYMFFLSRIL